MSYPEALERSVRTMSPPLRAASETLRLRPHAGHNLDQLARWPVPPDQPATLDYFRQDYVDHRHPHLRQVEALELPGMTPP